MATLYFYTIDGGGIEVMGRMEGEDGEIGRLHEILAPGDELFGVSYDQLAEVGNGTVTFAADGTPIVSNEYPDEDDLDEDDLDEDDLDDLDEDDKGK